jgi:DNA-binding SARP family transcriptional activator
MRRCAEGKAMTILTLTLLCTFAVRRDDVPLTRFRSDKVRALLAYLAVEADRTHPRGSLAALFWPDQSEELALKNLSQTLTRLREAIGDAQSKPPFLLATRQSVQWNPNSSTQLDAATFTRLAQSTAIADLEAADFYTGSFLHGFYVPDCQEFDEWMTVRREQTERMALKVFDTLSASYLAAHKYVEAEVAARRQLVIDPWRELAHRQVMKALVGAGQRTAALAQYAACTRTLAEELGVTPGAATTALYESIRDGTWQPVPMPSPIQSRSAHVRFAASRRQPPCHHRSPL